MTSSMKKFQNHYVCFTWYVYSLYQWLNVIIVLCDKRI